MPPVRARGRLQRLASGSGGQLGFGRGGGLHKTGHTSKVARALSGCTVARSSLSQSNIDTVRESKLNATTSVATRANTWCVMSKAHWRAKRGDMVSEGRYVPMPDKPTADKQRTMRAFVVCRSCAKPECHETQVHPAQLHLATENTNTQTSITRLPKPYVRQPKLHGWPGGGGVGGRVKLCFGEPCLLTQQSARKQ
jgi:hypothetical protein